MENHNFTPLSTDLVKGLGFEKVKQGIYSNGKFDLHYSDYGIAYTERCNMIFSVYTMEVLNLLCSVDDNELMNRYCNL